MAIVPVDRRSNTRLVFLLLGLLTAAVGIWLIIQP